MGNLHKQNRNFFCVFLRLSSGAPESSDLGITPSISSAGTELCTTGQIWENGGWGVLTLKILKFDWNLGL